MEIRVMQVGPIGTNCYLLVDEATKLCAVIDPGGDGGAILDVLRKLEVQVSCILLTHGHYDHTGAVTELCAALPPLTVYIHSADFNSENPRLFQLRGQMESAGLLPAVKFYGEGDHVALGGLDITVLHTPGHSAGSVTLRCGNALFCGDTLFAGSCGRTDFPDGSMKQMLSSLKRLGQLEGNYAVLPGHMETSDLDTERARNPYLLEAMRG